MFQNNQFLEFFGGEKEGGWGEFWDEGVYVAVDLVP
jgi:hypothetical protein